ncbi:MAG: GTP-binding protein, partial [Acidimicrobiales bacterium]
LFDPHTVETHTLPQPLSEEELHALLDKLPLDTVRAKGIAVAPDGTRLLVQQVGRRRRVSALPQAEDQEATDLVVIRL